MERPFLKAYVELLIKTCHRRGIHAMGGMAAQIPIKSDPAANEAALEKVRQDKLREVKAGHDGTWVAHPGLVPIAKAIFDEYMKTPNQLGVKREDVHITAADLLRVPEGQITEQGLKLNVDVGIQYIESWLGGNGCVPIYNLMEDAATAEISRVQVWQWRHSRRQIERRPSGHARTDPRDDRLAARTHQATRRSRPLRSRPFRRSRAHFRTARPRRPVQGFPYSRSLQLSRITCARARSHQ